MHHNTHTHRFSKDSLAARGFRMPAEWEPHAATWMSWPHPDGISFPDAYARVMPVFASMVDALAESEEVCINVRNNSQEADVRTVLAGVRHDHVKFHHIPTNEPWCRDHGPIFITNAKGEIRVVDWGYNAWGFKYPPFDLDDVVPIYVAKALGVECCAADMILEGGSIDVNGSGILMTTESCLLNPNRNPDLDQCGIERLLCDFLGVKEFIWLGDGIEGDDTDGHIDDIARFVAPHHIVAAVEENEHDANFRPLRDNLARLDAIQLIGGKPLQVTPLPMPSKVTHAGQRLPASYANFYIGNKVVLMPSYADPNDNLAKSILQNAFPDREVLAIDCHELIWGLGAFHCLTQQQPQTPQSLNQTR